MTEIGVVYGTLSLSAKGVSQQVIGEMGSIGVAGGKKASGGFLSSIGGVVGKVVGVTATGVAAVGGLIGGLAVKGGIEKALAIENAEAKMAGLGHSTETVATVMDNALAAVKGTAFGLGDAANVASTALASGIKPGAEMSKYLTLVADAAATAQVPLGEMGSIMGKVTNSGKVTNDVLNQFGDRGVGVLQMLAKEYGVTSEEMTKMVSKGQVDSATFNKVLTENFGDAAKKSGDTTVGAFANMKSALSNLGMAISGGFFPLFKQVFNQIQFTLEGVTERIKPFADAFGTWLQGKATPIIAGFSTFALAQFDKILAGITNFVTGFQQGMDNIGTGSAVGKLQTFGAIVGTIFHEMRGGIRAFGEAWKANDGDITSSGFPGFMERAAFAVRALVDGFQLLDFSSVQGFFDSIGPAAGVAGGAFSSIGESLTTLGPAFQEFGAQLPNIAGAMGQLAGVALSALTAGLAFLADNVDTIIAWMPAIVAGFIAWRIASKGLAVSNLIVNAAQAAMVPLTTVNNLLRLQAIGLERRHAAATGMNTAAMNLTNGSIVRSIAAWTIQKGVMIAGAVATGVATAAQRAMNAAMSANPIGLVIAAVVALIAIIVLLVMNWDTVVGFLKGVWDGFVGWFTGVMDGFLDWWGGVWDGFLGFLSDVWGNITDFLKGALDVIVDLFLNWTVVGQIVKNWDSIVGFFTGIWDNIVAGVSSFIDGFVKVFQGIITFLQPVIDVFVAMFGAFKAIFDFVVALAGFFVRGIIMLFQWWLGMVISVLTGIWDFIVSVWTNITDAISTAVGFIGGVISTAFNLYVSIISSVLTAIWEFVSSIWNKVSSFIGSVLESIGKFISSKWNAFIGMVSGPLNSIWGFVTRIWNNVSGFIGGVMGTIGSTISGAWNSVVSAVSGAVGRVYTAVVNKFNEVTSWLGGIGGRILGAIGDLGGLLFNAGRSILEGLLGGLRDMWNGVAGFFQDLTSKIPDWKGPADRDATLLTNAGHLIMGGFLNGLESQYGAVQKSLGGFTDSLSADASIGGNLAVSRAPAYAGAAHSPDAAASESGGGGNTTNFYTYNPVAEPTSKTLERKSSELALAGGI